MDLIGLPEAATQMEKWRSEYFPDIGAGTYWLIGFSVIAVLFVHFWPNRKLDRDLDPPSKNMDVELTPSSGQRPDIRLSVKNNTATGMFSAQCQILAQRNNPNQLKTGVFNLVWHGDRERVISISEGETQELLIARWKIWYDSNLGQLDMLEWTTKGPTEFWGARWNMLTDSDSLPEFDLEITIIQQGAIESKMEAYVLRPINCTGPLEMIVLEN